MNAMAPGSVLVEDGGRVRDGEVVEDEEALKQDNADCGNSADVPGGANGVGVEDAEEVGGAVGVCTGNRIVTSA